MTNSNKGGQLVEQYEDGVGSCKRQKHKEKLKLHTALGKLSTNSLQPPTVPPDDRRPFLLDGCVERVALSSQAGLFSVCCPLEHVTDPRNICFEARTGKHAGRPRHKSGGSRTWTVGSGPQHGLTTAPA